MPTATPVRRSTSASRAANAQSSCDRVLRSLPSHGWTAGWAGRRDRALLVLSQRAELSFTDIAGLTVDDIVIREGVATIRVPGDSAVTLRMTDDCLLCAPCALSRWLHILGLATAQLDGRVVASVIARAAPLTAHSPHVCEGTTPDAGVAGSAVFPTDDRWGPAPIGRNLPTPAQPTHDLRTREPGPGHHRVTAASSRPHLGTARTDNPPTVPVDRPTALENRARALLNGMT